MSVISEPGQNICTSQARSVTNDFTTPESNRSITEFFSPRTCISNILHISRNCEDITENSSKKTAK